MEGGIMVEGSAGKWQGQDFTVTRKATAEDEGYNHASRTEQFLVKLADGTEKVIPRSEMQTDQADDQPKSTTDHQSKPAKPTK